MNRRRQEEHKDETLFLDSILDCDLMDQEEVTAEAHLLSVFEGFLPKWPFSPQNPRSKVIVPKTTLRECNKLQGFLCFKRMPQTSGHPVLSSGDRFCCSCHLFVFSSLSLIQRGCMMTDDLTFNIQFEGFCMRSVYQPACLVLAHVEFNHHFELLQFYNLLQFYKFHQK